MDSDPVAQLSSPVLQEESFEITVLNICDKLCSNALGVVRTHNIQSDYEHKSELSEPRLLYNKSFLFIMNLHKFDNVHIFWNPSSWTTDWSQVTVVRLVR